MQPTNGSDGPGRSPEEQALAAIDLDTLKVSLTAVEEQLQANMAAGADLDRAHLTARRQSLLLAVAYLQKEGAFTKNLTILLSDLLTMEIGGKASTVLQPRPTKGRRPDHVILALLKGHQAALMEFQQKERGSTREVARTWVARKMPKVLADVLGRSFTLVDSWLQRCRGSRKPASEASRVGYHDLGKWLRSENPKDKKLVNAMTGLADTLSKAKAI